MTAPRKTAGAGVLCPALARLTAHTVSGHLDVLLLAESTLSSNEKAHRCFTFPKRIFILKLILGNWPRNLKW